MEYICKICDTNSIFEDHQNGVFVCSLCGLISNEYVYGNETFYQNDTDTNLNTEKLQSKSLKNIYNSVCLTHTERNFNKVSQIIDQLCSDVLLPNVLTMSKSLYEAFIKRKTTRGKIKEGIISCCIYHACRIENVPRSMQEISNICNISTIVINHSNRIFMKFMKDFIKPQYFDNKDNLWRSFNNINCDKKEKALLINITKHILDLDLDIFYGKKKDSIVSSILCYVCNNMQITICKKEVAKDFNVSIVTINKLLKELSSLKIWNIIE